MKEKEMRVKSQLTMLQDMTATLLGNLAELKIDDMIDVFPWYGRRLSALNAACLPESVKKAASELTTELQTAADALEKLSVLALDAKVEIDVALSLKREKKTFVATEKMLCLDDFTAEVPMEDEVTLSDLPATKG